MFKVIKKLITLLFISFLCTTVWAETDTITLHLRATVPPRVDISHEKDILKVEINSEDVDVAVYDMDDNRISDYSNLGNPLRFVFTAL